MKLNHKQVGPRLPKDRERFPPNNMLLMLTGAGLLWMGWSGFNGGAPFSANLIAGLAVLNTHVCAATSLLTWTTLDVIVFGKPSVIGAVQGMMTGLVTITPAAGTTMPLMRFPNANSVSINAEQCIHCTSFHLNTNHVNAFITWARGTKVVVVAAMINHTLNQNYILFRLQLFCANSCGCD